MSRRFSRSLLFQLRNRICISSLIRDVLRLPCRQSNGRFRFLCPVCSEFQTATNPRTNLGRCFRCGRNFNPIDMVMIEKGCGFVDAVRFLQPLLHAGDGIDDPPAPAPRRTGPPDTLKDCLGHLLEDRRP